MIEMDYFYLNIKSNNIETTQKNNIIIINNIINM